MTTQAPLPQTRRSLTHKFSIGGFEVYLTVGMTTDGRPAEVFCKVAKQGTVLNGLLAGWCRAVSWSLRMGKPLDEVVEGFRGMRFEPMGLVEGDGRIEHAESVLDYIVRWMEQEFGGAA